MSQVTAESYEMDSGHRVWIDNPSEESRQQEVLHSISSLASITSLSERELRSLLEAGRIEGVDALGFWLASRSAVEEYLDNIERVSEPCP